MSDAGAADHGGEPTGLLSALLTAAALVATTGAAAALKNWLAGH